MKKYKILHLEDVSTDAELVARELKKSQIICEQYIIDNEEDYIQALACFAPDIILCDHSLPSFNSLDALKILKSKKIFIPFILITANMSDEVAMSVVREGADDYILKDRLQRLPHAILNAIEKFRLKKEQRNFVDALVKNEKRFRALVENSADAVVILNAENKITYASPNVKKVLGYTDEEIMQMELCTLAHADDLLPLASTMEKVLANPGITIKGHTARMLHKDGSWRWLEATITNLLHDPAINGIVDNFRDVTEKKLAEQKLTTNENKFRGLIENGADGMAIISSEGKPLYVSPSIKNVLGYTHEEGMHLDLFSLAHPEDTSILINIMQEAIAKPGVPIKGDATRMRHKDGNWRWIDGVMTNMLNDPSIGGIVDNFRDVTERKIAEQVIKDSEEKYRSFFENSMDGILISVTDGEILAANPASCSIFQMTEEEICNVGRLGLVDKADSRVAAGIKERRETGYVKLEITLLRKNGSMFPGELTSIVYKNTLGEQRTLTIIRDISERKLAEEKIIQLNRLYAFISQINQTIVHSVDAQTVYKEACHIACEIGKFKVAWIGMIKQEEKEINLVESCGINEEDLTRFIHTVINKNDLQKHVLLSDNYYVCNDIKNDSVLEQFKSFATDRGYGSFIILPLKKSGSIVGTFNLYASQVNFFTAEEIALLVEASGDISFSLDVFEKQKQKLLADDVIQHKELRLNQAQAIAHVGSWEFDFSTNIALWSDEMLKIYGLDPHDNKQSYQSWISFIHPDDLDYVLQNKNEANSSSSNSAYFYRIIRRDGTVRHLYSQTCIEINNQGESTGLYGVAHDVTEMREAEEELRRSELNLQAIFNNTSEGFILADLKGDIVTFNNKAREIFFQNSGKEIQPGKSVFDFVRESMKEFYKSIIPKVASGEVVQYDIPFEEENGEVNWFIFTITRVIRSGIIEGFSITAKNITERKQAEQKLQESELFNKGVLESLTSHIAVVNRNGTIIAVNKAWDDYVIKNGAQSLKYASTGSNYFDVYKKSVESLDIVDQTYIGIQSVFSKEKQNFELEYLSSSQGEEKWFTLRVSNFGNDGSTVVISHTDTTIRKQAENKVIATSSELQKTLTDLNKIMDSSLDVIITFDEEGRFVTASAASERVWGYTPRELIGRRYIDMVFSDDTRNTNQVNAQIRSGDPVTTFENKYVHKDGRIIHMLWSSKWDDNDKVFYSIAKDVSKMKEAEEALRENEHKYRKLAFELEVERTRLVKAQAVAKVGSWETELQTLNVNWSAETYRIFGTDPSNFSATHASFLNFIHPYDRERVDKAFLDSLHTTTSHSIEHRIITTGGTEKFVLENWSVFQDENGSPSLAVGTCQDITERKKAEEENRFKANLLNTIGQAAIATDMNGNINYWNKAAEQIYGWAENEATGKNIVDITPSHTTKQEAIQIMDALKQGHSWSGEFKVHRKDGSDFPAFITNSPFYDAHQNLAGIIGISSDITEKKKLQNLLDKTSGMARIGSYEADLTNNTLYWSSVTKEIHEVDDEFTPNAENAVAFYKEGGSRETMDKACYEAKEKNIPFDLELQIVTAKGNERWVRVIGEAESNNGVCTKMYGSFQDIDKIKKAEFEVLKVYEEKNTILESIGDCFCAVDRNWNFTYWNKEAEIILGKNREDVLGKNIWEEVYPETVGTITYVNYHKAVEENTVQRYEVLNKSINRWLDISAYPSANGLSIYFKDITKQKQADDALKKSEFRYRQIVETTQEGIWVIDENNKTTFVNKRMAEMLGYTRNELMGENIQTFMDDEERKNSNEQIERRKKGISENHDLKFIRKGGKELWTNLSTNPILDKQGNYKGALAMITDISTRKEQELEIQKNAQERELLIKELTLSLKDLKQFSYITSHNFRAPLSNLIGLLGLVDYHTLDKSNREIVEMFKTSTNQLNKTINDLIQILIVKNNVNINVTSIDIRNSLNEVCHMLAYEINENHCVINLNLGIEYISFNPSYLDSILINLLSNAIKYRSPERPLQVDISTGLNTKGEVLMAIKDNGIGINLERHRGNMFGLYQRFHSNVDGAGLGLFMIKSQIISLGGSIEVDSEVGRGTTFYITFKEKTV